MKTQCLLPAIVAVCFTTLPLQAETKIGFRQLASTTPVAVQRGKKTTIGIRSNYTLDGAYKVFFDKPGIKMKFLETKPIAAPRSGRGRPGTPFRFEVDVPADQPLGVYECRVATKTAVSSVTHLLVTDYPVIQEEKKENGTPETAQPVSFPVAICGMCERSEDIDYYRVSGKAGQELTFNIYAQRVTEAVHSMQSGHPVYLMDAILTLYSSGGQVIAQNDNFSGGDSFIACKLPETGDYVLEVRDTRYYGNGKYVYCVEIADKPFAHAVFPMAVQRGTSVEAEIIGHLLGGVKKTTLSAAKDEPLGWTTTRISTAGGQTNPVPLLICEHPQVLVTGEHNSRDNALPISLPVGVNHRILQPEETHYYSFNAVKDAYYLFEVEAHRHGSRLDSLIEITNADGKRLTEADDGLQTKDAKLYFKAPADGVYFISLRDLHDRGGERFYYHLRAEPSGPDFEMHGEYYYAQIAPGTRMIWFARINRLNGFDGPVEMQIEGLPLGVSFTPVTIPPGMNHCSLILTAAADAKIDANLVRVFGKTSVPDADGKPKEIVRYGRVTCELQSSGGGQGRWPIKTQIVGVTNPLDLIEVEATPNEITLEPGKQAEITVRIERSKDYKDPVTLAMSFKYFTSVLGAQLPPGVTMSTASKARLSGKILEGTIVLESGTGKNKPPPMKRFPIAVLARVSITFSITTNYCSNPIYLTIPGEIKVSK